MDCADWRRRSSTKFRGSICGRKARSRSTRDIAIVSARALASCDLAAGTMKAGLAPEYMAVDLRAALRAVGEITGAENVEEILDSLFAQFCIGK